MSKNSRQNLYRFQGHAILDALDQCPGGMPLQARFDSQLPKLPCPICLEWKTYEELTEDHAPPRAQQSSLGLPRVVVMTCKDCNGGAGRSYEGAVDSESKLLWEVPSPFCQVHSQHALTPSGLVVKRDLEARGKTDLKAAYLVAFATLGHRWALAPRLDAIRKVLRSQLSPIFAADDFEFICGHSGQLDQFCVYEVTHPITCIVVMGAHAGVVLPAATSPRQVTGRLVTDLGRAGLARFSAITKQRPWPRSYVSGPSIEKVWDAHDLFHYDRCTTSDHSAFAVDRHQIAAAPGLTAAT